MNLELYREIVSNLSPEVTLRHDVDVSIEAAVIIAEIDSELGRKSTFYLRNRSPYYNLNESQWATHELWHLGRERGAHIDISPWEHKITHAEMDEFICDLLKGFETMGCYMDRFTFHRNSEVTKTLTKEFYSFENRRYRNDNICPDGYVSDARGIMPEIPSKGVLNLHPEWWVYPGNSPKEKLEYYFNQQKEKCLKEILPDLHS